jgi:hypothetical protein
VQVKDAANNTSQVTYALSVVPSQSVTVAIPIANAGFENDVLRDSAINKSPFIRMTENRQA